MRVVQRARHLGRDPDCFTHGELLVALELATEGLAGHVGHHIVEEPTCDSGIEEWQDVRVLQTGGDADLREESVSPEDRGELRSEDLQRHLALMLEVLSLIDCGHSAAAELALDRITAGEGSAERGDVFYTRHGSCLALAPRLFLLRRRLLARPANDYLVPTRTLRLVHRRVGRGNQLLRGVPAVRGLGHAHAH